MTVAVLFPGQGSIAPGAGAAWADHPAWSVVGRVEEAAGRPIAPLLLDAPAEALATTDAAQLATLALSLVAWEAVRPVVEQHGIAGFAGHSLGQITALLASGALDEAAGLSLAVARADACRAADDGQPGRLAALLGATLEQATEACAGIDGAWIANDNAPGQIVIGGTPEGLAAAIEAATAIGVRRAMPLAVGGAFHTPLLQPAADALRPVLEATVFTAPSAPLVDNTDAIARTTGDGWVELLTRHLVEPVRWQQVQRVLVGDLGATEILEVAPAGTLTAMAKRTIPDTGILKIDDVMGVNA